VEHAAHAAPSVAYNVNLQADPARPRSGEPVRLSLVVTEQSAGEPLLDFELLHDRLMHLILVSEDLSVFEHIHPRLLAGAFESDIAFPRAGLWKLWAEAKPAGSRASVLAAFRLRVAGEDRPHAPVEAGTPGYAVELDHGDLVQHQPVRLTFRVRRADGTAVTDLEPLMGAGGHCVIVSEDLKDFVHVHPQSETARDWRGGPEVAFETAFHRPGGYAAWGQFQHAGQLLTAPFRLQVMPAGRR